MSQERRQHVLDLKIPPVGLGFITATLMWIAASTLPAFAFVIPARSLLAAAAVLIGATISFLGAASFRRARTTVNPMKPESASALVESGLYKVTRNPMYLGFFVVLVGWAIFLSNLLSFLVLPGFVLYLNRFQIEPEEKALAATFGSSFDSYKTRVRRWL